MARKKTTANAGAIDVLERALARAQRGEIMTALVITSDSPVGPEALEALEREILRVLGPKSPMGDATMATSRKTTGRWIKKAKGE